MRFGGKVALVTGASRGLGRAIATSLAREGARLTLCGRDGGRVEEAAEGLRGLGAEALAVKADVAVSDEVEALVEQCLGRYGRLDILVNNAGITRDGLCVRLRDDDWDAVLDVDLTGAFRCCRAALRPMLKQRAGRIINISSVVGVLGNAGQVNYVSAKAGLIGLTKGLAREVAGRGITVNAVAPGFVETEMTAGLPPATRTAYLAQIPLGRFGTSAEVAAGVLYLASDAAAYVTGQVLHINGGMWM